MVQVLVVLAVRQGVRLRAVHKQALGLVVDRHLIGAVTIGVDTHSSKLCMLPRV